MFDLRLGFMPFGGAMMQSATLDKVLCDVGLLIEVGLLMTRRFVDVPAGLRWVKS